jgi:sirohydrochlorin ferrochelatase
MTRALIVAHGQPSDPRPAGQALEALAGQVTALMPGWQIGAATLAEPGRLEGAAKGVPGVVFPLFMAGGWFTRVQIPGRLQAAGAQGWQVLEPFGCLPAVHDLTVRIAQEAGAARILLAAHGSFKSAVPSAIANHVAGRIAAVGIKAEAAFIDQSPQLETATGFGADAACLPFFAMAGGHVEEDIPAALTKARFLGRILPPDGLDARVPALIAMTLAEAKPICADRCRWA